MDEEVFNLQMRKFLKKVGITAQREIEKAVREGIDQGTLTGTEEVTAKVTLCLPELGAQISIDDKIALE